MEKLKLRWQVDSNFQLLVIFFVFAITGSSATFVSKPVIEFLGITKENLHIWIYWPIRIIVIFPVYQVLLVFFGFMFGQFRFFWNFEKKMLQNLRLGFVIRWFER
jgi:manganese efflux pump family protein